MMDRVKLFVEELVDVHESMEEILPSVDDEPVNNSYVSEIIDERVEYTHIARQNCAAGIPHQYKKYAISAPRACNTFPPNSLPSTDLTMPTSAVPTCSISPFQVP